VISAMCDSTLCSRSRCGESFTFALEERSKMKPFGLLLMVTLVIHESSSFWLPEAPKISKTCLQCLEKTEAVFAGKDISEDSANSRRNFLLTIPALAFAGSQLLPSPSYAEEQVVSKVQQEATRSYVDRTFRFRLEYPAKWLISKRAKITNPGGIGGIITPNGGYSSTGTIFVAGNYQTGVTVGISYTDVRRMLEDAGYDSSGKIETIPNIGRSKGVADLLVRQRDGNPKEPSPVSRVVAAETNGPNDTVLNFTVMTITKIAGTGIAPKLQDINLETTPTNYRRTTARSIIKDGILITAWASALEEQWEEEGPKLERIIQSFEVADKYALSPVIGGYTADLVSG